MVDIYRYLTVPGYCTQIAEEAVIFEDFEHGKRVEWRTNKQRLADLIELLSSDAKQALGDDAEGGDLLNIHIQEALADAEPGASYLKKTSYGFNLLRIPSEEHS